MELSKRQELQRVIKSSVEGDVKDKPLTFTYCEGLGFPRYEVTIKRLPDDTFVDANGNKWIRVKKEDER